MPAQIKQDDNETYPDERGYNGWSNYETWCTNLHLTNDQDLYHYANMFSNVESLKQAVTDDVYKLIESQSAIDPRLAMMYQDLLVASLQSVNWYEVYDSLHEGDNDE